MLRNKSLYINLKKCDFCLEKIVFLGYDVSAKSIEIGETKVKATKEWHTSKMVS